MNSEERMNIDPTDMPFEVGEISKVGDSYIEMGGGWCIGIPPEACEWVKPGMAYELWGKGSGFGVRGIAIDGRVVYYQTEGEHRAQQIKDGEDRKRKELEEFERSKDVYFAEIAALPEELQARFERFQKGNPSFDVEFGAYELFCCKEAVVISDLAKIRADVDYSAVEEFWGGPYKKEYPDVGEEPPKRQHNRWLFWARTLDFERQKEVMGINDGHSGNTFSVAFSLAQALLSRPERATEMHGAMTPVVGCEAYGCTHNDGKWEEKVVEVSK